MDMDIKPISHFAAPPALPPFTAMLVEHEPGMPPDQLDRLDAVAAQFIAAQHASPGDAKHGSRALAAFNKLSTGERVYVALAANDPDLLRFLHLTIAEAIDRLDWVDASAMVARWRNRRG